MSEGKGGEAPDLTDVRSRVEELLEYCQGQTFEGSITAFFKESSHEFRSFRPGGEHPVDGTSEREGAGADCRAMAGHTAIRQHPTSHYAKHCNTLGLASFSPSLRLFPSRRPPSPSSLTPPLPLPLPLPLPHPPGRGVLP